MTTNHTRNIEDEDHMELFLLVLDIGILVGLIRFLRRIFILFCSSSVTF